MTESNYINAIREYRDALNEAAEIANDTLRTPEQIVETTTPLLSAIWKVQVQTAVMMSKGE